MLQSIFFNIRGRATCWLTALSFLFYYSPAVAADKPAMGATPQIQLYYSIDENQRVHLRSFELLSPLTGKVVANCGYNIIPGVDKCVINVSCVITTTTETNAILVGYRLTDVQVYEALMKLVGGELSPVGGTYNCLKPGASLRVTSGTLGETLVSSLNWGATTILDPEPMQDPECVIRSGTGAINGPLEIGYGQVISTSAHGLEASTQLNVSCKKRAYMQLSVAGYNPQQGISLLPDGSLTAKIYLNQFPAWPGASLSIEGGTAKNIPISSTLQVNGALAGGKFEGSTVIRLEYF
ncbi:hypothetical protein [Serratia fonticola]|uniref:MrpH family fimbial adhesin n=1 Tax=Serratia fonticola TaxID=47917 RepID=UPI003AAC88AA